ncbi:class GN sortase [Haliea sp. E17]|uniref:class GN sortase n=1 Tax=Haliea sp. E17 TaxID=3401576 RepID=UPI003AABB643
MRWYWLLPLLAAGLQQLGTAGLIHAKALLAPLLVASAWDMQLADGVAHKPWPWADTWPVAHLRVPELSVEQFVLAGTRGNALAFGPGLDAAGAIPGTPGIAVIGGHRDTHFSFLREITPGMRVALQLQDGNWRVFAVSGAEVIDTRKPAALPYAPDTAQLQLVTCYPFDSLDPGGPLRYVVNATLEQTLPVFNL